MKIFIKPQKRVVTIFILFLSTFFCVAQSKESLEHHSLKGTHRISFGLGHTSVSNGEVNGKTRWLPFASWSLNYDYWINNKWAIGLQNDWILETFKIIKKSGEAVERKNPIAIIPVAMYKWSSHWSAIAGIGMELSSGHNLTLTRLGIEYGLHLPQNWEAGVALVWDNKWNYYNSWGVAFTFSKMFSRKMH